VLLIASRFQPYGNAIERFEKLQKVNGAFQAKRSHQALSWLDDQVNQGLKELF
jgi:hypothetical protein